MIKISVYICHITRTASILLFTLKIKVALFTFQILYLVFPCLFFGWVLQEQCKWHVVNISTVVYCCSSNTTMERSEM